MSKDLPLESDDLPQNSGAVLVAGSEAAVRENLNPYVGPRPFSEKDANLFFGRDLESEEIVSLIISHPILVLHAESGAGKSSLLNARVIPLLREQQCHVLQPVRMAAALHASESGENLFTGVIRATLTADESRLLWPSTQGPDDDMASIESAAGVAPVILIFDQFEELFTVSPEHWRQREQFFARLGEWLESNKRLRVLLAMREEYVMRLERYASLVPERFRTRYRLERLRENAALDAIEHPMQATRRSFAPGAAEKLVQNLMRLPATGPSGEPVADEFVEPVQLQLVCNMMWSSLLPTDIHIDVSSVERLGDVDRALQLHYERCVASAARPGTSEARIRQWLGALITTEGTRGIVFRDRNTTAGLPNAVVVELERLYLLRAEVRGTATWYELSHDRFILPITRSNHAWAEHRKLEADPIAELEELAKRWHLERRRRELLLSRSEVNWYSDRVAREGSEGLEPTQIVRDFLEQSAHNLSTRRLRRLVALTILVVLALICVVLAISASLTSASEARKRERSAKIDAFTTVAEHLNGQPGKEFEALMWAIQAVGDALSDNRAPSANASAVLRQAVATIGDSRWIRSGASPVVSSLSPHGVSAAVADHDSIHVWDLRKGMQTSSAAVDSGYRWTAIRFLTDDLVLGTAERRPGPARATNFAQFHYRIVGGARSADFRALHERLSSGSSASFADTLVLIYGRTRVAEIASVLRYPEGRRLLPQASTGWTRAAVSPSGRHIIGLREKNVEIWTVARRLAVAPHPWSPTEVGITFAPDGQHVVLFGHFSQAPIQIWQLPDGRLSETSAPDLPRLRNVRSGVIGVRNVQFSRDGRNLLVTGIDDRIAIIPLDSAPRYAPPRADEERVHLIRNVAVAILQDTTQAVITIFDPILQSRNAVLRLRGTPIFVEPDTSLTNILVQRHGDVIVTPTVRHAIREVHPHELVRIACEQISGHPEAAAVSAYCPLSAVTYGPSPL